MMLSLALILIGFFHLPAGEAQPQAPPVLEFVIPMHPVEAEHQNNAPPCPCMVA